MNLMKKCDIRLQLLLAAVLLGFAASFMTGLPIGEEPMRVNSDRLLARLDKLSEFGRMGNGVHRVAFSEEDIQARKYLIDLMESMGLKVRTDAAGNIFGRREGREPGLPVIMFGSHSDTVPEGGRFDGALGVAAAMESMKVIMEKNISTRHPLEVVVFVDEEGGMIQGHEDHDQPPKPVHGKQSPALLQTGPAHSKSPRAGREDGPFWLLPLASRSPGTVGCTDISRSIGFPARSGQPVAAAVTLRE